jgi:DNA-directed RNA polymerase specialized sigma24 family protein
VDRDSLVRAACLGDSAARNKVGLWLHDELWSFFSNSFDPSRISDLIQDTMVDIWAKLGPPWPQDAEALRVRVLSFAGISAKAATRELERERARKAKLTLRQPTLAPPTSVESQQLKQQQLRLLERYMWQLPPAYRDVLRHRLAEGDDSSWAEQRNIAVSTVRWQYARACKLLGQLIKRAGVTNPSSSGSVSAG